MSICVSCNCAPSLALPLVFASFYCVFPINLFILFFAVLIQYWMNLWESTVMLSGFTCSVVHMFVEYSGVATICTNTNTYTSTECVEGEKASKATERAKKLFDGKLSSVSDDTSSEVIIFLRSISPKLLVWVYVMCFVTAFFSHTP